MSLSICLSSGLLLAATGFSAPLPEGPGKKLVEEICSFCHGVSRLEGHAYTRDQWSNVIKGMVSEGAPVTDEEFSLILDYLAKNFGPPPEQDKEEQR